MTRPEHILYERLIKTFGYRYYIFPQMHLESIIYHKTKGQNWHGALRHIDEKSVDFVLCDKNYISPILAIELDDHSHDNPVRVRRDKTVEEILNQIKLPLCRIKNDGNLKSLEIMEKVYSWLPTVS